MKNCLLFLIAGFLLVNVQAQGNLSLDSMYHVQFQVQPVNGFVLLQWTAQTGEEVKSFDIERADDGSHFIKVGSKLAKHSGGEASYDFVDATPKKNIDLLYRLKLISSDSSMLFSENKIVRVEEGQLTVKMKQNPVQNSIELEVTAPTFGKATITIVSSSGLKVLGQSFRVSKGANQLSLSSQEFQKGIYQLMIEAGDERKTISLVKE